MRLKVILGALAVITVNVFFIPLLTELYVYWYRPELLQCFYIPKRDTRVPYTIYRTSSKTTATNTLSLETDNPTTTPEAYNLFAEDLSMTHITTSTLVIDQVNIPAQVQSIELAGIDGSKTILWKNR